MTNPDRWRSLFSPDHHSVRVDRVWRSLKAELSQNVLLEKNRTTRRLLVTAMGAGAAAVVATLLFFLWPSASARPLATDSGEPFPQAIVATERTLHRFSDGSSLDVSANTALDLLENSEAAVRFSLKKGHARFDIRPGGSRLWQVVCGEVNVVVLGTAFSVERDESHVSVNVERGEVSVHGTGVKYGAERLVAGQSLRVVSEETQASSPEPLKAANSVAPERSEPKPDDKDTEAKQRNWNQHAVTGAYAEAFADPGSSCAATRVKQTDNVDELFQLADAARFSGQLTDAIAPLTAIVNNHAGSAKAGLAAYTLGRLYLDQLSMPEKAAALLEKALVLGIPGALQEAAMANRIKALWLLNDYRKSALAKEYLARYPRGRYRGQVVAWAKGVHRNQ